VIVLDNSVLSALRRLNKLDILAQMFGEVAIPDAVKAEFLRKWAREDLPAWVIVLHAPTELVEEAKELKIGRGEAEAIALSKHLNCPLAVDDEKAREKAKALGIPIIGTVGILRLAYETCPIETKDELKKLLDRLSQDLHIEKWLIDWALKTEKQRT